MKSSVRTVLLLAAFTAGCSTMPRGVEPKAPIGEALVARWEPASAPLEASQNRRYGHRDAEPPAPKGKSFLNDFQRSIFESESFQRRFAESYLSEVEVEPRVDEDEVERLQEVMGLISEDDLDAAGRLIEKNLGESSSAVFDFMLANIHFQRDELEPAAESYEVAVGKYPKFRRAWRNLGVIRIRQTEYGKAITAFAQVIELGGGDAVTYGLLGFAYASMENYLSAETAYRMALMLDPKTLDWKTQLARTLFKQERYADASALCGALIAEYPERGDLWLLQANAFIGLEQPVRAAENYELVDRLGQSTVDSLNMLGDIYSNEELFDLAVEAYARALELPDSTPDRAIRAAGVMALHNALDSVARLIEVVEATQGANLDDEERKSLLKLEARVAVARGATGEEARVLEQIVELDPLDGEALILLGQHHDREGRPEKAVFYFERAESIEVCEADAKVRHAQLLVRQGKYVEALPLLRSAQRLEPRDNVQEYLEQVERVAGARSR